FNFDNDGQVTTVMLSRTKVSDADLKHLVHLGQLDSLSLLGTSVTDEGLAALSGLRLERLNLSFTSVTDKGLVHVASLTKLREVALMGTAVTVGGVMLLKDLSNLVEVDLSWTPIVGDDLTRLRKAMPRCTFLGVTSFDDDAKKKK